MRKNNSRIPVIGVTVDISEKESDMAIPGFQEVETILWLKKRYTDAIEATGGAAIMIPFSQKMGVAKAYLDLINGLVITGGDFDLDPAPLWRKKDATVRPAKTGEDEDGTYSLPDSPQAGDPDLGRLWGNAGHERCSWRNPVSGYLVPKKRRRTT